MRKFGKEISLAFLNPKLSKEWDYEKNYPLKPEDVFAHSHKKASWKCQKGHKWDATISNRSALSYGCPYCSGQKVGIDNCLATVNPNLAKEWDYEKNRNITPNDVTKSSGKKVGWICKNKHRYLARIADRSNGHGCPYCAGYKACKDNCLATVNPELSIEWDYENNELLRPEDVTVCSHKKVGWICKKYHRWRATIGDRTLGNGCPYCSCNKVCKDNCLATVNPNLAKEWDYEKNRNITPNDVTKSSGKKVGWICKNKHRWIAAIYSRNNGDGCPYCHKIALKDGTVFDSITEASYGKTELIDKNITFHHHVKIGLGKCSCDFYIPSTNTYIETTGYTKKWKHWLTYYKNILRKKHHITKVLKSKFQFIQLKLTRKQIQYVRENSI